MPEKRGKILVIRGGAIGDFILTLPAIAALRSTFPNTHLELLGYPKVAALARAAGIIDEFRSIEARPLARFFARQAKLDDEWSAYFESFNLMVSYLYDPDEIFKTNIGRTSKAQFIQGLHRPHENESIHAASVFLAPLEHLAIFDMDPVPTLPVLPVRPAPGRWLAAHPGSGGDKKNWPEECWRSLFQRLIDETDFNLLLIEGEAEEGRVERISRSLPARRVRLAQNLPLFELAQGIAGAEGFVGHDSGITHIAAALGCPTLVLWGPSKEEIWKPLNPGVRILRGGADLSGLSAPAVFDELLRACRPRPAASPN